MGRCIPSAWRQYANADDFCESEAVPVPPNFGGPVPIVGPPVRPVGPMVPVAGPAVGGPILAGPGMCGPCGLGFACRAGACVRSSALSKQTGLQATLAVVIGAGLFI